MQNLQKGSVNIVLILIIFLLIGVIGYLTLVKKSAVVVPTNLSSSDLPAVVKPSEDGGIYLSDKYYFSVEEPVIAVEIVGKFYSPVLLNEYLSMDRPVGEYNKKTILLFDILYSIDTNALGDVAMWEVAGPKSLIEAYVKSLKAKADDGITDGSKNVFYDFGTRELTIGQRGD